jgi:hypothetical protein
VIEIWVRRVHDVPQGLSQDRYDTSQTHYRVHCGLSQLMPLQTVTYMGRNLVRRTVPATTQRRFNRATSDESATIVRAACAMAGHPTEPASDT